MEQASVKPQKQYKHTITQRLVSLDMWTNKNIKDTVLLMHKWLCNL